MGGSPDDLDILLTRANEALSRHVFEDATARAREIIEQADEHVLRLVQTEFSLVKDSIEEAKTIGIDIDATKSILREARAKAESQELVEAYKMVKQVNDLLRTRITRYDTIKGKIRKTEELISEAGGRRLMSRVC